MAAPLNESFCLKDDRRNFTVNFRVNREDRAAYFGKRKINEKIIENIRERYMMGSQPKKYLYGQYGVGKTHTLFNPVLFMTRTPRVPTRGLETGAAWSRDVGCLKRRAQHVGVARWHASVPSPGSRLSVDS